MIILFDVDGTLVESGKNITVPMGEILIKVKEKFNCKLGIIGGGIYLKLKLQLDNYLPCFDYIFPECGALGYFDDKLIYQKNLMDVVNRITLNKIIKEFLKCIIDYDIIYAGHLIDRRFGLYYLSPVGMQGDDMERNDFIEKDRKYNIRRKIINSLKKIDVNDEFDIVLGGSTGLAVTIKGWNKSQILEHIDDDCILFFGDKIEPDGNDYPLFSHPKVKGFGVKNYQDTISILNDLISDKN